MQPPRKRQRENDDKPAYDYDLPDIVLGVEDEVLPHGVIRRGTTTPAKKRKRYYDGPETCNICKSEDHFAADCPQRNKSKQCFGCGETGHIAADCPIKKNRCCHICGDEGHFARDCPRKQHKSTPKGRPFRKDADQPVKKAKKKAKGGKKEVKGGKKAKKKKKTS